MALRLLPAEIRPGMSALYAFCRVCDDIADGAGSAADKRGRLNGLRRDLERHKAGPGAPEDPVLAAFAHAMRAHGIRTADVEALMDGVARDLNEDRYATFGELAGYCDGVAAAVGRMCLPLGALDETTLPLANDLGFAMQITNILQDIAEDARRGRIYLPLEG